MSIVLYLRGKATYLLLSPSIFFYLPLSSTHARMQFIYELTRHWCINRFSLVNQPLLIDTSAVSYRPTSSILMAKRIEFEKRPHYLTFSLESSLFTGVFESEVFLKHLTQHLTQYLTFSYLDFLYFRPEKLSFIVGKNLEV